MRNVRLHIKVLVAFLLLSLLPLTLLALFSLSSLNIAGSSARDNATLALDDQATRALELRVKTVAAQISGFLQMVEEDLGDLALIPPEAGLYRRFAKQHQRPLWPDATGSPLYKELAYIDPLGHEQIRLAADGSPLPLRDLADPAQLSYPGEDYFLKARQLENGQSYISYLTGWYLPRDETAKNYEGVIRFAMPRRDAEGGMVGVVVLSLDHRHLEEFTRHLTSTPEGFLPSPSYEEGNYAFMFDDEGWMIAHPKYWDIRGLDADGALAPPYRADTPDEVVARGVIPFNLLEAGFIHPNYPVVAREVLAGRSGVVDVTNVGGARKIMAYAPIRLGNPTARPNGIFGGVTLGAEVNRFHQPALAIAAQIDGEIRRFSWRTGSLIAVTLLLLLVASYRLSRSITRPLLQLISGTKEMARGNLETRVLVSGHDEVADLAAAFNAMAVELNDRSQKLVHSLSALKQSRQEILRERDFKETIIEHVEIGIVALDATWRVTSLNRPLLRLLNLPEDAQTRMLPLDALFESWPLFLEALKGPRRNRPEGVWSQYVSSEGAKPRVYRLALLPLASGEGSGCILTIEDLTERVAMRKRLARMDRLASLGRLSAGIAHEVRNPLTGISLLLDELHDRLLGQQRDQELIRRALNEIERLEALVNELLTFSAQSARPRTWGDLGSVIRDTLFFVRKESEKYGVELDVRIDDDLPAMLLDGDRLKQALLNLLGNALDAMPHGGTLQLSATKVEDEIHLIVRDSGAGITPESIPLIFEPFYTSKGEGTGLGLSITHNIVADHGGRIEVESTPGAGTTFTLIFPIETQDDEASSSVGQDEI